MRQLLQNQTENSYKKVITKCDSIYLFSKYELKNLQKWKNIKP